MLINAGDPRPIFLQIAEGIEDAILTGAYPEESQIPSTTEISVRYNINPATALKGVNILVEAGIIYKKRGVGMFVKAGAVDKLREKRKDQFYENYILKLTAEAKRLGISPQEIILMIERGYKQ
ncbi:MAG: GntR family transcriptional regulator [Bacillota bacterium]